METEIVTSSSQEETHEIAQRFAARLRRGDIVALCGELGAGKTEFVRGICAYFEVEDIVTSPTFSIINLYTGHFPDGERVRIAHIDLYRITSKQELTTIGFGEWMSLPDVIKLIEWPEKANGSLERAHYRVTIRLLPGCVDRRQIQIVAVPTPFPQSVH